MVKQSKQGLFPCPNMSSKSELWAKGNASLTNRAALLILWRGLAIARHRLSDGFAVIVRVC